LKRITTLNSVSCSYCFRLTWYSIATKTICARDGRKFQRPPWPGRLSRQVLGDPLAFE
jgi:hypothetical protein